LHPFSRGNIVVWLPILRPPTALLCRLWYPVRGASALDLFGHPSSVIIGGEFRGISRDFEAGHIGFRSSIARLLTPHALDLTAGLAKRRSASVPAQARHPHQAFVRLIPNPVQCAKP